MQRTNHIYKTTRKNALVWERTIHQGVRHDDYDTPVRTAIKIRNFEGNNG